MAFFVTAIHTFVAEHADELEFQAGDRIEILEKDEAYGDGWWKGRNSKNEEGLFPATYISEDPNAVPAGVPKSGDAPPVNGGSDVAGAATSAGGPSQPLASSNTEAKALPASSLSSSQSTAVPNEKRSSLVDVTGAPHGATGAPSAAPAAAAASGTAGAAVGGTNVMGTTIGEVQDAIDTMGAQSPTPDGPPVLKGYQLKDPQEAAKVPDVMSPTDPDADDSDADGDAIGIASDARARLAQQAKLANQERDRQQQRESGGVADLVYSDESEDEEDVSPRHSRGYRGLSLNGSHAPAASSTIAQRIEEEDDTPRAVEPPTRLPQASAMATPSAPSMNTSAPPANNLATPTNNFAATNNSAATNNFAAPTNNFASAATPPMTSSPKIPQDTASMPSAQPSAPPLQPAAASAPMPPPGPVPQPAGQTVELSSPEKPAAGSMAAAAGAAAGAAGLAGIGAAGFASSSRSAQGSTTPKSNNSSLHNPPVPETGMASSSPGTRTSSLPRGSPNVAGGSLPRGSPLSQHAALPGGSPVTPVTPVMAGAAAGGSSGPSPHTDAGGPQLQPALPINTAVPPPPANGPTSSSTTSPGVVSPTTAALMPTTPPSSWTVHDVVQWAQSRGFDDAVRGKFIEHDISGDVLLELDANLLKELDIPQLGKRLRIASAINDLRSPSQPTGGAAGAAAGALSNSTSSPHQSPQPAGQRDFSGMALPGSSQSLAKQAQMPPPQPQAAPSLGPMPQGVPPHGQMIPGRQYPSRSPQMGQQPLGPPQMGPPQMGQSPGHSPGQTHSRGFVPAGVPPSSFNAQSTPPMGGSPHLDDHGSFSHARKVSVTPTTHSIDESSAVNTPAMGSAAVMGSAAGLGAAAGMSNGHGGHPQGPSHTASRSTSSVPTTPAPAGSTASRDGLMKRESTGSLGHKKKGSLDNKDRLSFFGRGRKAPPPTGSGNASPVGPERSSSGRLGLGGAKPAMTTMTADRPEKRVSSGGAPGATVGAALRQIGKPDKVGYLKKRGERYNTWKTRYFVLKGSHLYYLKSESEDRVKGHIDLKGHRIIVDDGGSGNYGFRLVGPNAEKPHFFASAEQAQVRDWMKSLMKATIARDYSVPVTSSCNIPTIPLAEAQALQPRPPSPGERDATQRANRRENVNQLTPRDASVLMSLDTSASGGGRRMTSHGSQGLQPSPSRPSRDTRPPSSHASQPRTSMAGVRPSVSYHPTEEQAELLKWVNEALPPQYPRAAHFPNSFISGEVIFLIVKHLSGIEPDPPVPSDAFAPDAKGMPNVEGLLAMGETVIDAGVDSAGVSLNEIRAGDVNAITHLLETVRSWAQQKGVA